MGKRHLDQVGSAAAVLLDLALVTNFVALHADWEELEFVLIRRDSKVTRLLPPKQCEAPFAADRGDGDWP